MALSDTISDHSRASGSPSITFPRKHSRGYAVDSGNLINSPYICGSCGNETMYQTVSLEWCTTCGAQFDYWGGGGNQQYRNQAWRKAQDPSVDWDI